MQADEITELDSLLADLDALHTGWTGDLETPALLDHLSNPVVVFPPGPKQKEAASYFAAVRPHLLRRLLDEHRARVAELEGRVGELEGERDEAYRKGLREALRMGEANAATLYIDLNVGNPSEAAKNVMNGVNIALFPIKRELEALDRARSALGEGNHE